jgi:hypothetical protein
MARYETGQTRAASELVVVRTLLKIEGLPRVVRGGV